MVYNLHTHTTASDGKLSPKELIDYAIEKKLTGVAITDHNTVKGIPEALGYSKGKQIEFIPGIEISCDCEEKVKEVHIVGLFIDYENPEFKKIEEVSKVNSRKTSIKILEELKKFGYNLEISLLDKGKSYNRLAIAELLMEKYPKDFPERQIVFDECLGFSGKIKVNPLAPSMEYAINTIHNANGIAILAHPGYLREHDDYFIQKFISLGGDGIEIGCSYSGLENSEELREKYRKIAKKNNLLISGGSEFHYEKGDKDLGDWGLREEEFEKLKEKLK